jgi:hypothetical protein
MTDSKVRPADAVAVHAATQWSLGKNDNERVNRSAAVIAGYASDVRAEAEAAGYRRAVRDCADLCEQVACGSKLNTGERYIAGRCAELIRDRFGDGSSDG